MKFWYLDYSGIKLDIVFVHVPLITSVLSKLSELNFPVAEGLNPGCP